jgi:tetratricopeptide (TPR) repeat protein
MELCERAMGLHMSRRPWGVLTLLTVFLFSVNLCWAAGSDESAFSKGVREYKGGNFEGALKELEKAVQARPDHAASHFYLGLCLSRLGKNEDAALALEKARELNPKLPGLYLNLGIVYYKLEAFEPALLELNRAIEEDPKSGSAHLFKGMAFQGAGEYKKSIPPLEKARELDPDYTQLSWYYIGIAYYKTGRREAAEQAFRKAIDADPKSDTAGDAQDFLNTIAAKERAKEKVKKRWWIKGSAGIEYDDNLTVEERDIASGVDDWAAVFEFEGGYRFVDRKPFEAEVTYEFYQSFYEVFQDLEEDTSQLNNHSHTLGLSGNMDVDNWDFGLDYDYNYMLLGDDSFLQTHSISPSVGYLPLPILYVNLSYIFQIKDFLEEIDEPRDGVNHSVGFDTFLFFMKHKGYVQLGYRLESEDTTGDEFDYTGHIATCAVKIPLPYKSKVRFMYQYHFKDYLHITPSIGEEREDNRHTFNVVVTKEIFDYFELKVDYEHIRSDSNLPSVDYHENVVYMGVSFRL